jgi:hypothetical protein
MKFDINDAKQAEAFTNQIASASFTLTGKQIIEVYKSFAWFNKICSMIEKDLTDGKKPEPKPNRRTRGSRSRPLGGDCFNQPDRDQGGSEPAGGPPSGDGL